MMTKCSELDGECLMSCCTARKTSDTAMMKAGQYVSNQVYININVVLYRIRYDIRNRMTVELAEECYDD